MWSPLALSPPRSVAPARTSSGHQSARFGGTCTPTPGSRRRHSAIRRRMSSIDTGVAHGGQVAPRPGADARAPQLARRGVGDLRGLAAVVARVRDEVLQDDLLQVAVAVVRAGQRLERGDAVVLALADADEDPARERDAQLAGGEDRLHAARGVLGRRALVGDEVRVGGFEHEPLRRGDLAQPGEVVATQDAEVRVRQQAALERALARPHDVADEVLVAVLGEQLAHAGVDLRTLARQHEQLLDVAPRGAVEERQHLARARAGACGASRTRSTCSSSGTCATARA